MATKKKNKPKCVKGQVCGFSCISLKNKDGTDRFCRQPIEKEKVEEVLTDTEVSVPKSKKASSSRLKEDYSEKQKMIIERLKPKTINSGLLASDEDISYVESPSAAKVKEKANSLEEDGKNLQPVIMRRKGEDGYEVVYGEDWVEAAKQNGGQRLFTHVFDMTDEQAKETRKEMEKLASQSKKTKIKDTGKEVEKAFAGRDNGGDITTPEGRKAALMKRLKPRSDSSGLIEVDQIEGSQNKPTAKAVKEKVALLEKHGKNLQPVVMRRKGDDGYEVVYGEDWVEAAKKTKQERLWSHVYDLDDEQAKEMRQKLKNLE